MSISANDNNDAVTGKRTVGRVGYGVAVAVNIVLLFIVNNLLAWGWVPFLTDDFERLLPIVNLSLVVGAGVNFAFIFYNASWFRSAGQILQNVVSLFVTVATLKIFPFDFSPYGINWAVVARVLLILIFVALVIGTIVESVKMIRSLVPGGHSGSDSEPGS
ncbi:MAG: hypothetical protein U9N79_01750 [Actinomycetota bacterium]|nr:hypothetical protein [Actinomycetota bacterium]